MCRTQTQTLSSNQKHINNNSWSLEVWVQYRKDQGVGLNFYSLVLTSDPWPLTSVVILLLSALGSGSSNRFWYLCKMEDYYFYLRWFLRFFSCHHIFMTSCVYVTKWREIITRIFLFIFWSWQTFHSSHVWRLVFISFRLDCSVNWQETLLRSPPSIPAAQKPQMSILIVNQSWTFHCFTLKDIEADAQRAGWGVGSGPYGEDVKGGTQWESQKKLLLFLICSFIRTLWMQWAFGVIKQAVRVSPAYTPWRSSWRPLCCC